MVHNRLRRLLIWHSGMVFKSYKTEWNEMWESEVIVQEEFNFFILTTQFIRKGTKYMLFSANLETSKYLQTQK